MHNATSRLAIIPRAFLPYRQFINWFPSTKANGAVDKIPCDQAGEVIDAHDPATWVDAETACASGFQVGFVFTKADPFWFLDVDHAWNGSAWSELATWCGEWFPGAAFEISQSGTGAHWFGSGAHVLDEAHGTRRRGLGLEFYTSGRFVALTGISAAGDASTDHSARLTAFLTACDLPLREEPYQAPAGRDPAYTGPDDDEALIQAMLNSQASFSAMFGAKATARQLWEADVPALARAFGMEGRKDGCPYDRSAADAAMMFHLSFWTGRDLARMQRLFERCALYRPERYSGRYEYRMERVLGVGARNPRVYDRPRPPAAPAPILPAPGATVATAEQIRADGTMSVNEQIAFFKGCVYVEDMHGVLMPDGRILKPHVFDAVMGGYKFQMQYDNGRPSLSAFECFTASRMYRFPKAKGTCFLPRLAPGYVTLDGNVNTWVPPVIDEAPGDITPFLRHLALLLPNETDRRIMLAYMKACAQKPGFKFQWAPVVQGVPGNGKSLFIRVLVQACGLRYSHLPKASQLTEKYNSWIAGNVFIGVEEIKIGDKKREILDDLKDAITNDRLEIRRMASEKKMADNVTNWFFCTNYKDAVPIDRNERRYAPFYTAQQTVDDLRAAGLTNEYFQQIYDWLKDGGGYQAVTWFLRNTPIDPEYDPSGMCQRAPATSSMNEAILAGMGRIEQEIMEAIETNEAGFRGGWISGASLDRWLEHRGARSVSPSKKSEILKTLGYSLACKSTKLIHEEGSKQPRLYHRKNGERLDNSQATDEFLTAQGYYQTLRPGNMIQGNG